MVAPGQGGFLPQRLLVTLLGDYWFDREEHLPSAALVQLLAEFGVSDAGTRAALSRLSRRGLLVSSRSGRRTFYGLSERATALLRGRQAHPRLRRPGPRVGRHLDRGGLLCPRGAAQRAARAAHAAALAGLRLGLRRPVGVAARLGRAGRRRGDPIAAWDLQGLRQVYEGFIAAFEPLCERARAGEVSAAEALRARTQVMDAWRNIPNLDPELPLELLPPNWPRRRARKLFVEVYDSLGPLAEMRIKQILAHHAPDLASLASYHASDFTG